VPSNLAEIIDEHLKVKVKVRMIRADEVEPRYSLRTGHCRPSQTPDNLGVVGS
jgi:hypothetical protein